VAVKFISRFLFEIHDPTFPPYFNIHVHFYRPGKMSWQNNPSIALKTILGPFPENDKCTTIVPTPHETPRYRFVDAGCEAAARYDPTSHQIYFHTHHYACIKRKHEGPDDISSMPNKKRRVTRKQKSTAEFKLEVEQEKLQEFYADKFTRNQERLKACSGRDEMCYSVLNDDWASHPTWASEDSGFVAHRKNVFEEALHRIEEERHDYDYYIEANSKVIQLLEPIGQQILTLSQPELAHFRMPAGLGGQSQSIYKRILKKIYGPKRGQDVAEDLFANPISVLPVVLARLKQKDEEWRFTQAGYQNPPPIIIILTLF
jgi:transcription termination factor NusB